MKSEMKKEIKNTVMKTKCIIGAIVLATVNCILPTALNAQDFHLSQFDAASQYMNPALTGMYLGELGDYKIATAYRSQWKALDTPRPFSTVYISYDTHKRYKEKKFGYGGYIANNRAGSGHFNTLDVMLSGAYDILQNSNDHYLSAGLQMGIFQKSFDPVSYTYDVQYDPTTGNFNQSSPSQESGLDRYSIIRFDSHFGIHYKYFDSDKKWRPYAGFSVYHVNRPFENFINKVERLPFRFNLNAGCDLILNDRFTIIPKILYMNEARAHEMYFGLVGFYKMKDNNFQPMLGFDYRNKDAFVIEAGVKQDKHIFRISYDINTSYLKQFTGGRGALEFSLIITGIKGQPLFVPPKSRIE